MEVRNKTTPTDFLLPLLDIPRPDRFADAPHVPAPGPTPDLPADWQRELGKVKSAKKTTAAAKPAQADQTESKLARARKAVVRFLDSREFKKTLTWRITAFADTTFFTHLLTKHAGKGALIGALEAVTKTFIKYYHEKYWNRVDPNEERLIARAISYRAIAAVDTFGLALLVTGNLGAASGLVALEFVSKAFLHWLHDKAWKRFAPAPAEEKAPAS